MEFPKGESVSKINSSDSRPAKAAPLPTATYAVPALASFKVAAHHLGAPSAAALRRRFERGIYPKEFILPLTPQKPGVDLHGLLAWMRRERR